MDAKKAVEILQRLTQTAHYAFDNKTRRFVLYYRDSDSGYLKPCPDTISASDFLDAVLYLTNNRDADTRINFAVGAGEDFKVYYPSVRGSAKVAMRMPMRQFWPLLETAFLLLEAHPEYSNR
jgi:hypothetical protein